MDIKVDWSDDVVLYQREDTDTGNYYVRINRRHGSSKYLRKSLKTTDLSEAITNAKELYLTLRVAEARGVDITAPTFKRLSRDFLKTFNASATRIKDASTRLVRFNRIIGLESVSEAGQEQFTRLIVGLYNERHPRRKSVLSRNTLLTYRQLYVQIINYAYNKGHITVPERISKDFQASIPTVGENLTDRVFAKGLSETWTRRYDNLINSMFIDRIDEFIPRKQWALLRLKFVGKFLYHSFVRFTTEMTALKWSDLKRKSTKDNKLYYIIHVREAKDTSGRKAPKTRMAVFPYQFVQWVEDWKDICIKRGYYAEHHYIFPQYTSRQDLDDGKEPKRINTRSIAKTFRYVLEEMSKKKRRGEKIPFDMTVGPAGRRVNFQSLVRHTAITNALIDRKTSVAHLARLAGTSSTQIDRSYQSEIMEAEGERWASAYPGLDPNWKHDSRAVEFKTEAEDVKQRARQKIIITPIQPETLTNIDEDINVETSDDAWSFFIRNN